MSKHLAAWTPAISPYPPFVSISHEGNEIKIIVRAGITDTGEQGAESFCIMTRDEFLKLIYEAVENLEADKP